MRKEASVYLGIFSVSSIKNTFNKLLFCFFFFLRLFKKPFGGSSWLFFFFFFPFILDLYLPFCCVGLLLLLCVCERERESCYYFWHFRWLGGGVAAAYSPLLLPPPSPTPRACAWRSGYQAWLGGGAEECWVRLSG